MSEARLLRVCGAKVPLVETGAGTALNPLAHYGTSLEIRGVLQERTLWPGTRDIDLGPAPDPALCVHFTLTLDGARSAPSPETLLALAYLPSPVLEVESRRQRLSRILRLVIRWNLNDMRHGTRRQLAEFERAAEAWRVAMHVELREYPAAVARLLERGVRGPWDCQPTRHGRLGDEGGWRMARLYEARLYEDGGYTYGDGWLYEPVTAADWREIEVAMTGLGGGPVPGFVQESIDERSVR